MVPGLSSWLGGRSASPPQKRKAKASPNAKKATRALPASWYTSQEMYELERRAIFSRRWMFITHSSRVSNSGDWLKYEVAGYPFVICKDRTGKINAFHNVCRHRAFPIVTEDKGSSKIFACKYHGWSYGLNGKLAKAPKYDELEGFDKSQNGLLPIHVHLDKYGFIWVNLDAKPEPEVAWTDDFLGIDQQERCSHYDFDEYSFDHTWEMKGDYNWKILADNYNECYHCPTSHPDIPAIADLESYSVQTTAGHILHDTASTPEQQAAGMVVAPTYFFPNASMNVTKHFLFIQRFVPHGPVSSTMRYEVFRHKDATEEQFQLFNQMYKRIMSEDKYLCNHAQQNINNGVFVNGEMHPKWEQGPLFFQGLCREAVVEHHEREQGVGKKIWPAQQQMPEDAEASREDIEFCSGLACAPTNQEVLAW